MSRATSSTLFCEDVQNFLTPLAETFQTPGSGYGSRAIAVIAPGTPVATFGGVAVSYLEVTTSDPDRRSRSIQVEKNLYLLGPAIREPGDSINHSCNPNCGMGNASMVVAMRMIEPGEELTFDYAMSDSSDYDEFECQCKHSNCRGMIRGSDWNLPHIQQRYQGFFSPYIQRMIDAAAS